MKKRVVFSAVEGWVSAQGAPLAELEVTQTFTWFGVDAGEVRVKTDAEGRFSFPELSRRKLRVSEPMILQEIKVSYEGKQVLLWEHTKESTGQNDEFDGRAISLRADLERPPRDQRLPTGPTESNLISGVSTLLHPYFEALEAAQAKVSQDKLEAALNAFLQSDAARARIDSLLRAAPGPSDSLEGVQAKLTGSEDWHLCTEEGHFFLEGKPRYLGCTLRAALTLDLSSGASLNTTFFSWTSTLSLDSAGAPDYRLTPLGNWEVDLREHLKACAEAALVLERVEALALDLLRRDAQLLEAFAGKDGEDVSLTGLDLDGPRVTHVKEGALGLRVEGTLRAERGERPVERRVHGHFLVEVSSLDEATYRALATEPARFHAYAFRVHLKTDKESYALGEPITLTFTIENLTDRAAKYLRWHTPFEGFRNNFLELKQAESGTEVAYHGIMAKRARPTDGCYLEVPAEAPRSTTIEITQAYPLSEAGPYTCRFKALAENALTEPTHFELRLT